MRKPKRTERDVSSFCRRLVPETKTTIWSAPILVTARYKFMVTKTPVVAGLLLVQMLAYGRNAVASPTPPQKIGESVLVIADSASDLQRRTNEVAWNTCATDYTATKALYERDAHQAAVSVEETARLQNQMAQLANSCSKVTDTESASEAASSLTKAIVEQQQNGRWTYDQTVFSASDIDFVKAYQRMASVNAGLGGKANDLIDPAACEVDQRSCLGSTGSERLSAPAPDVTPQTSQPQMMDYHPINEEATSQGTPFLILAFFAFSTIVLWAIGRSILPHGTHRSEFCKACGALLPKSRNNNCALCNDYKPLLEDAASISRWTRSSTFDP